MIKNFEQFTCTDCGKNITEGALKRNFHTHEISRDFSSDIDFLDEYDILMNDCLYYCIEKVKQYGGEVKLNEKFFLDFYRDLMHSEEDMPSYAGTTRIYFKTIKVIKAKKEINPLYKHEGEQYPGYTNENGEYLAIVAEKGSALKTLRYVEDEDDNELRVDRETVSDKELLSLSSLLNDDI
jgi:hypothetical protein